MPSNKQRFLAHSANDNGRGIAEPMQAHLQAVAERCSQFAEAFDAGEQGFATGLLHDIGKYSDYFLKYISPGSSLQSRDHWSVGALACALAYKKSGAIPALAVQGHHTGLQMLFRWEQLAEQIKGEMNEAPAEFTATPEQIQNHFRNDGFTWPKAPAGAGLQLRDDGKEAVDMLNVRMLFSALVDADYLETEAHFQGDAQQPRRYRASGSELNFDHAINALNTEISQKQSPDTNQQLNVLRQQLFKTCCQAGESHGAGLFTLSAPTGAGKTLAMLGFALHHARRHGLRRVVVVLPFLNIIEQTAQVYRELFSRNAGFKPHDIVEHHSLSETSGSGSGGASGRDGLNRLLAENWDAPIIITTSVQFLESLMANRTTPCRKLHRLAQSVILMDEVQTLPPNLAVATLATLSHLADPDGPFKSSVLMATATQPAFEALHHRVSQHCNAGWQPQEIGPPAGPMYAVAAGRVRVDWRHEQPVTWQKLADELQRFDQCLCIVNLKRHARNLAEMLQNQAPQVHHLSTDMVPAHRSRVLAKVRQRLRDGQPVRLISTQCIEAGVDIDFPVVYRALAPLEAIAQAAGRCNRNGESATGRFVVFKPSQAADEKNIYPPGYLSAVTATETFLQAIAKDGHVLNKTVILNDTARLARYFKSLYGKDGRDQGEVEDEKKLLRAIKTGDFKETAKEYRLIDGDTINVLAPYDRTAFNHLKQKLENTGDRPPGFVRDWIRAATPHSVSINRPKPEAAVSHFIEPVEFYPLRAAAGLATPAWQSNWFIALDSLKYDTLLGVVPPEDGPLLTPF